MVSSTTVDRPAPRVAAPSAPCRSMVLIVAFVAALPTLAALLFGPELILDDLQFAAIARFEGLSGFVEEMGYRPGQGIIHGLQFTLLGTNASMHLAVLAAVNAVNAVVGLHLVRRWCAPDLSAAVMAVWLLLPDHGSTRFWVSTVPNHVALTLVLVAALFATNRTRRLHVGPWLVLASPLVAAVLTYEAVAPLAVLLVGTVTVREWRQKPISAPPQLLGPLLALGAVAAASLFVLIRSPRAGASSLLAAPVDGVFVYLTSLDTLPLGRVGLLLVPTALLWAALDRRRSVKQERSLVVVGIALAFVGLSPFLVAGFNVASVGVLDRSLFFAGLGTAATVGSAVAVAGRARGTLSSSGQRLVLVGAGLLAAGSMVAVFDDLGPYRASWAEQRSAATALSGWLPPDTLDIDPNVGATFVLQDVPIDDGVAWAHYGIQVRDLYRLVNDSEDSPMWLGLTWNDDPPTGSVSFTVVDGRITTNPPTAD